MADDFVPDNDFVPDPPEMQNKIEPHENFLQKAINSVQSNALGNSSEYGPSISTMGPGGIGATLAGQKNMEQAGPGISQGIGNIIGGDIGLKTAAAPVRGAAIGGTIGRAVGEVGKQGIDSLFRGQQPSLPELGKETGLGAATEALNMPFNFATLKLMSGPAGEEFRNTAGKILGGLKNRISNSGVMTDASNINGYLRSAVDHIRSTFEVDPGLANHLESMADDLENVASNKGGMLEPQDLMNAQKNLDLKLKSIGIYGNKIPRDYAAAGEIASARGVMSGNTQDIADQIGIGKQFSRAKDVYSTVASDYPQGFSKHGILKNILEAGGIHSLLRGNIPEALTNTIAAEGVGSSALRNGIYNALKVGKVVPAGIASGLSTLLDYMNGNKNQNYKNS